MGCWNKTCGLSHLHICAGEDTMVVVLQRNTSPNDRCYSTAFWEPVMLPFYAVYDDYGGGEECTGFVDYIMESIANRMTEVEQGDNEYRDIPVKKEGFNVAKFFEAVHEGRLYQRATYAPEGESYNQMIDFVMLRMDIVNQILDTYEIEKYVGDGKGTCGWDNNYIKYKFADVLADVPAFLDALQAKLDEAKKEDNKFGILMLAHQGLGDVFEWNGPNKAAWWIRGESSQYSLIIRPSAAITELMSEGEREQAERMFTDYLRFMFIDGFMHDTRINWAPGGHEGSQSQEHSGYRTLIKAISNVLDKEQKEWGEED